MTTQAAPDDRKTRAQSQKQTRADRMRKYDPTDAATANERRQHTPEGEDRMKDEDLDADLARLIAFLEHERARPSSCTPDIVRRFDRAIDKHLSANFELPMGTR